MRTLSAEETPAVGGLGVAGVVVPPDPHNSDSWLVFERNGASGAIPDERLETIHPRPDTTDGVLTIPLSCVHVVVLQIVTHCIFSICYAEKGGLLSEGVGV